MDEDRIIDFDDLQSELDSGEEKKGFHPIKWLREHPGEFIALLGSSMGLLGTILSIIANKHEYKDNIWTTDQDGNVFKIPAKEMKTVKGRKNLNVVAEEPND